MIALADAGATFAAGAALAPLLRAGDMVTLAGPLGAGKTTFARGVLAALGLTDEAPSPSFAIVIAYAPPEVRLPLWHVDLYRLDGPEETTELGLEDALEDGALLVEWPDRLDRWMRARALALEFVVTADGGRGLTWKAPASWEARWPPR